MYILYVLQSEIAPKSYVGITNNLQRRLGQHNCGKHAFTKRYMPWKVIYTEQLPDLKSARIREKYFKSAAGRRYMKKVFGDIK